MVMQFTGSFSRAISVRLRVLQYVMYGNRDYLIWHALPRHRKNQFVLGIHCLQNIDCLHARACVGSVWHCFFFSCIQLRVHLQAHNFARSCNTLWCVRNLGDCHIEAAVSTSYLCTTYHVPLKNDCVKICAQANTQSQHSVIYN